MPVLRRIAAVCLFLLLAPTANADCINGSMGCSGDVNSGIVTTDAVRSFDCSRFHVDSHMSFDHIQGLASAQSLSVPGNTASSSPDDNYVLTGPPVGTVVPITVVGDFELQNVRQVNAATVVGGQIWTPPILGAPDPSYVETFLTASAPGTETETRQIQLVMNFKVGQQYEISLSTSVRSAGNAGGYAHGRLSFSGLPPGSSITSCKGFRQDQPVPALPTSWGALKVTYR